MKKQLLTLLGCLLATGYAFAADSVNITDGITNASSGTYAAGSSFTLNVGVTGDSAVDSNGMGGYSLWLAPGSSGWNNFFTITGDTAGSTFNDKNFTGSLNDGIVSGGDAHDLGATTASGSVVDGTYSGGQLTISIGNSVTPGTYTIHTTAAADNNAKQTEVSDGNFNGHFVTSSVYTINVAAVPEPATMSLFGLGALGTIGLAAIRRRRMS